MNIYLKKNIYSFINIKKLHYLIKTNLQNCKKIVIKQFPFFSFLFRPDFSTHIIIIIYYYNDYNYIIFIIIIII